MVNLIPTCAHYSYSRTHCNQLVYTLINDNFQIITLIKKTPSFVGIILPKHFLFLRGKTGTYRKTTSCQLRYGGHALRRKTYREPTSDASTTSRRRQDCDELGQAGSLQLYDLQSAPSKVLWDSLTSEGISHQERAFPAWHWCLLGAACQGNARTQLLSLSSSRSCPQAWPPSLLSHLSTRGRRPRTALRSQVAQHHWSEGHRCQFRIGWPGEMPARDWSGTPKHLCGAQSLGDPPCWGLTGSTHSSSPIPPPQRGPVPNGGPQASGSSSEPLAPPPGTSQQEHAPNPTELQKRLIPPAP